MLHDLDNFFLVSIIAAIAGITNHSLYVKKAEILHYTWVQIAWRVWRATRSVIVVLCAHARRCTRSRALRVAVRVDSRETAVGGKAVEACHLACAHEMARPWSCTESGFLVVVAQEWAVAGGKQQRRDARWRLVSSLLSRVHGLAAHETAGPWLCADGGGMRRRRGSDDSDKTPAGVPFRCSRRCLVCARETAGPSWVLTVEKGGVGGGESDNDETPGGVSSPRCRLACARETACPSWVLMVEKGGLWW